MVENSARGFTMSARDWQYVATGEVFAVSMTVAGAGFVLGSTWSDARWTDDDWNPAMDELPRTSPGMAPPRRTKPAQAPGHSRVLQSTPRRWSVPAATASAPARAGPWSQADPPSPSRRPASPSTTPTAPTARGAGPSGRHQRLRPDQRERLRPGGHPVQRLPPGGVPLRERLRPERRTGGSNGTCATSRCCSARTGYDGPTGWCPLPERSRRLHRLLPPLVTDRH
jgi:hypothetical protein